VPVSQLREVVVLEHDWQALLEDGARMGADALAQTEAALQFDDPINIQ
jgi:fatty-acyl-CoA synthase